MNLSKEEIEAEIVRIAEAGDDSAANLVRCLMTQRDDAIAQSHHARRAHRGELLRTAAVIASGLVSNSRVGLDCEKIRIAEAAVSMAEYVVDRVNQVTR